MPLFEVAILEAPSKKKAEEEGAVERLVYGPTAVVAANDQGAAVQVAIKATAEKTDLPDPSLMVVLVRPFA